MIGSHVFASLALAALATGCLDTSSGSPGHTADDGFVAEPRAFGIDAFPTYEECQAAKERGDYHTLAPCQDEILLCPDGSSETLIRGDVVERPTYQIDADTVVLDFYYHKLTGTLAPDGTMVTDDARVWQPIDLATVRHWQIGPCPSAQ
jgi:hypothetical protein